MMNTHTLVINANPLLNLVHTDVFVPGAINRVESMEMHAEGKGVNVARVLARLGHHVLLTGFAGGHSGAWLREIIQTEGIEDCFVVTASPIRVGFMASSTVHEHPTTVLPNGFPVTRDECMKLRARVKGLLGKVKLVIISGSVPDPIANALYADILLDCHQTAVPCWLDAHGEALRLALKANNPPAVAKPNREEYAQSCDWNDIPELHITDGNNPIEIRSQSEGNWSVIPPIIRQVNPIGSGDCYVAGLAHGWLHGWPIADRIRFASAAGAANAISQGVAMISPDIIESLCRNVLVQSIDSD